MSAGKVGLFFHKADEMPRSRGGRHLRLPLRFGLRPQGPCRVGTGESGLGLSSCSSKALEHRLSSCGALLVLAWRIPGTGEPGGLPYSCDPQKSPDTPGSPEVRSGLGRVGDYARSWLYTGRLYGIRWGQASSYRGKE